MNSTLSMMKNQSNINLQDAKSPVRENVLLPRVLVVEDAPDFQILLKSALTNMCEVEMAGSLDQALFWLKQKTFDLIILDIMLPDGNGFQFYSQLQEKSGRTPPPVVFLTGKTDMSDKVMGFALGAEDYITKPFDVIELKARVESRLKKIIQTKHSDNILYRGKLKLDVSGYAAYIIQEGNSRKLELTPIEYKLLFRLAKTPGHILSRQQLIDSVYGVNTFLEDRSIDKHISSLRKKMGEQAKYIKTVSGVGYQFLGET